MSYDSPSRGAEDIGSTPLAAPVVNVKPSRIGSLRALFEVYARCAREWRPMYGGGMGELGVGRGQIELLGALLTVRLCLRGFVLIGQQSRRGEQLRAVEAARLETADAFSTSKWTTDRTRRTR